MAKFFLGRSGYGYINCYMLYNIIIIDMVIIWIHMEYYGNMVINGDHHFSIGYGSIPMTIPFLGG